MPAFGKSTRRVAPMCPIVRGPILPLIPMPFIAAVTSVILAVGPAVWMSVCGIMSLFLIVTEPPRSKESFWLTLNAPPFSDQLWHPFCWCVITILAVGVATASDAEADTATADAARAVIVRMRFGLIVGLLPFALPRRFLAGSRS